MSFKTIGNGDLVLLSNGFKTLPDGTGQIALIVQYGEQYSFKTLANGDLVTIVTSGAKTAPDGSLIVADTINDPVPPSGGGSGIIIPYFYFIKSYKVTNMAEFTLDATTLKQGMGGYTFPMTITLNSAEAGRKIEISTNNEKSWDTLTPDVTAVDHISVAIFAPISNFKVTGAIGDTVDIIN